MTFLKSDTYVPIQFSSGKEFTIGFAIFAKITTCRFSEAFELEEFTRPHVIFHSGGPRFMRISLLRISLLRFFKIFHKYLPQGAFTYDVRFLGRQVGQATSDFTKQAYVVKYLIWVGRQVKNTPQKSDVICECSF